ncbi:scopoletin glucosyltransferase-like [Quercus lobata]|uniref:Glycosyltransferase n=1 Tax=Quercus lobata TaxID=97700 RepID=A0A7N2KYL7_QUELO|nr:scopoletin glucosyltransferase-like [Quercus lobata]
MGGVGGEIFVVTGAGQGHLHPCMELCTHLSSRNFHTTLVIPSISGTTPTQIPSSFSQNPLTSFVYITSGPPMRPGSDPTRQQSELELQAHITTNRSQSQPPIICAIVDFQIGWTKEVFQKFNIPVVSFVSFGACAAAMELGAWKAQAGQFNPGEEARFIPGLPEEMAITPSDLKRKPVGPPPGGPPGGGGGRGGGGPPKPGDRPPWVPEVEGAIAMMFNTCDDLERPFIDYMTAQMEMPAWGVGPLLPEQYWKSSSSNSVIRDRQIRQQQRQSNYTEEEVIQWLDSKPRGSVLYVAFGSEVGPSMEEYPQIAAALEHSTNQPFIWVIQPGSGIPKHGGGGGQPGSENQEGYYPHGLDSKVGERGLIIKGWAPQLLILSHPSTGGFLSHCGWNSTAEAIGRGVPFLAWPIRGDQHYNAKLVVSYLKVGYKVAHDLSEMVKEEDIVRGIERLMGDQEMHGRAARLRAKFENGFPASSEAALDAFGDFIRQKAP